jgi:hypothetical protein
MLPLPFIISPVVVAGKLLAIKVAALTGFRFAENGLDWPATLEDLKRDHRMLTAIGTDTVKLVPAITRLQRADTLEAIIRSAHDIKRAVDHLPEKTRNGLNRSVGLSAIIDAALRHGLNTSGRAILKQRPDDEDVPSALARTYFGLFLVGRGGGTLTERDRTNVILELCSLHTARSTREDLVVVTQLQTWLPEKAFPLGEALYDLKEAFVLMELAHPPMFKVYITRALGGDMLPLNEPVLLDDLTERFPEQPSTTA